MSGKKRRSRPNYKRKSRSSNPKHIKTSSSQNSPDLSSSQPQWTNKKTPQNSSWLMSGIYSTIELLKLNNLYSSRFSISNIISKNKNEDIPQPTQIIHDTQQTPDSLHERSTNTSSPQQIPDSIQNTPDPLSQHPENFSNSEQILQSYAIINSSQSPFEEKEFLQFSQYSHNQLYQSFLKLQKKNQELEEENRLRKLVCSEFQSQLQNEIESKEEARLAACRKYNSLNNKLSDQIKELENENNHLLSRIEILVTQLTDIGNHWMFNLNHSVSCDFSDNYSENETDEHDISGEDYSSTSAPLKTSSTNNNESLSDSQSELEDDENMGSDSELYPEENNISFSSGFVFSFNLEDPKTADFHSDYESDHKSKLPSNDNSNKSKLIPTTSFKPASDFSIHSLEFGSYKNNQLPANRDKISKSKKRFSAEDEDANTLSPLSEDCDFTNKVLDNIIKDNDELEQFQPILKPQSDFSDHKKLPKDLNSENDDSSFEKNFFTKKQLIDLESENLQVDPVQAFLRFLRMSNENLASQLGDTKWVGLDNTLFETLYPNEDPSSQTDSYEPFTQTVPKLNTTCQFRKHISQLSKEERVGRFVRTASYHLVHAVFSNASLVSLILLIEHWSHSYGVSKYDTAKICSVVEAIIELAEWELLKSNNTAGSEYPDITDKTSESVLNFSDCSRASSPTIVSSSAPHTIPNNFVQRSCLRKNRVPNSPNTKKPSLSLRQSSESHFNNMDPDGDCVKTFPLTTSAMLILRWYLLNTVDKIELLDLLGSFCMVSDLRSTIFGNLIVLLSQKDIIDPKPQTPNIQLSNDHISRSVSELHRFIKIKQTYENLTFKASTPKAGASFLQKFGLGSIPDGPDGDKPLHDNKQTNKGFSKGTNVGSFKPHFKIFSENIGSELSSHSSFLFSDYLSKDGKCNSIKRSGSESGRHSVGTFKIRNSFYLNSSGNSTSDLPLESSETRKHVSFVID
ncbi:hypothetical protein BB559_004648 [Furculomyces boomerangus]|uniref:Uncharacterized protein n=1 Tax=Furculomyces boomerangus TaxID=61424 RepID=A0A2T9YDF1_9FUNG|nr:hypothetical protein BB559_004648 [Furculomyces boomerangus]